MVNSLDNCTYRLFIFKGGGVCVCGRGGGGGGGGYLTSRSRGYCRQYMWGVIQCTCSFKSSLFNLNLVEFAPGFRVLQCFLVTLTLLFVNIIECTSLGS